MVIFGYTTVAERNLSEILVKSCLRICLDVFGKLFSSRSKDPCLECSMR